MTKKTPELELKPRSCWDVYASKAQREAMDEVAGRYVDFLSRCKTERETVDYAVARAVKAGFREEFKGKAVYRIMRGKSLFLARKGKRPLSAGFRLVGAHGDTPRLDFKQHPLYEEVQVGLAKTHYYGGIRKHQWLARPLALHGVVVKADGRVIPVTLGEEPTDPVFTIADLLPHLAYKQVEKKLSEAFEAEKLNVILGHAPAIKGKDDKENGRIKKRLLELLHVRFGIVEADLLSAELQAVPAGPARFVGLDGSLVGGYGQDDRSSVFCALEALLAEKTPEHTQVVVIWDKEEIGSEGSTGAQSLFLEYCLQDLLDAWESASRLSKVFLASEAISADVHPAVDPDYQDVHEKLNSAYLGFGPCFCKYTGHRGKVGANDAHPEYIARLRRVLDGAGVPWQMAELGKVDLGGGGTVAKHLARYGLDIIDMGTPVLSMHSPFELTSKADIHATVLALRAFLKS
ncbi:MAG TPA: aminopeptidase [Desulfovibrio sp.]|jgi:aspartyl aminopeptidase|uniref:aminopeptidase n=1 Tax=Desulfovibrio TaxID=872 RepID=UPI0004088192|nr:MULTISPECIES: aminopeptidase [Desulfovibrio]MDY0306876.1 aminopeptidase [Desulfovibrionaceae bacterium]HMM37187.1 aminopeptidase [Desulfovibrio sp.]